MPQHLTTILANAVKSDTAKSVAAVVFALAWVVSLADEPSKQATMLWMWAAYIAVMVGWTIIAKVNYHRWLADEPKREAEAQVRRDAWIAEEMEKRSKPFVWVDWDGPTMVGGHPR